MPTFFTPINVNNSGWQKVGTDVLLITSTDRLLMGLSTTDLGSTTFVRKNDIYCVDAEVNAVVCGFSTVGGVASIVSTSTGTQTTKPLLFYVPTEKMRLDTSGQLGIGLTNASALLHVKFGSDGSITKFERSSGPTISVDLTTALASINVSTNHPFRVLTNNTVALYVDTSQRLGVGTSVPSNKLAVVDTNEIQIGLMKADGGAKLELSQGTADAYIGIAGGSGKLQLGGAGSLTLTMLNNGFVGIQNIAPSYILDVAGTFRTTGFSVLSTGAFNCQVGETADQGFKFYVLGTSKFAGAITYISTITATDFTTQVSLGKTKFGSAAAIDVSAAVEILSTTLGFLLPRMTTAQRDAISSPAAGLVVYNTTTNKINVRVAAAWEAVTSV